MKENIYTHDHFNTWQACKSRYYFKYIKKMGWPDFEGDYELGQNFHALIDYYLRGFQTDKFLEDASDELQAGWELIKNHPILDKNLIKTEWGFNSRIGNTSNWLTGRIDAIFYDKQRNKYIIADWKTGKYIPKSIEPNFQHKVYLYALYSSQKDLGLEFKAEELEFQYIKIRDTVSINTIEFSREKEAGYKDSFLSIIEKINAVKSFIKPDTCPINQCGFKNLCYQ